MSSKIPLGTRSNGAVGLTAALRLEPVHAFADRVRAGYPRVRKQKLALRILGLPSWRCRLHRGSNDMSARGGRAPDTVQLRSRDATWPPCCQPAHGRHSLGAGRRPDYAVRLASSIARCKVSYTFGPLHCDTLNRMNCAAFRVALKTLPGANMTFSASA
jgi:hypothetical protein